MWAPFFRMGFLGRFAFWFVVSVFVFGHINIFERPVIFGWNVGEQGIRLVWRPMNIVPILLLTLILSISGVLFKSE